MTSWPFLSLSAFSQIHHLAIQFIANIIYVSCLPGFCCFILDSKFNVIYLSLLTLNFIITVYWLSPFSIYFRVQKILGRSTKEIQLWITFIFHECLYIVCSCLFHLRIFLLPLFHHLFSFLGHYFRILSISFLHLSVLLQLLSLLSVSFLSPSSLFSH